MNREILFRGKIQENQTGNCELDWASGDKITELSTGRTFMCDLSHFDNKTLLNDVLIEVIPETVGQFTGKEFKDKQKLFDGDIFEAGDGKVPTLIFWNEINAAWYAKNLRRNEDSAMDRFFNRFIGNKIGNRWDNPELLGGDGS